MKFNTAIVPVVATLCTVLANGEASYGRVPTAPKPVSFTEEGLNNAINVGIQSPKGNQAQSVTQAIAFFKRNPSVVKSIMAEADKKEHTAAKTEAVKMFMGMYKAKDQVDLYDAKLKAVSYAYEHPEFLDLVQKVIFRVTKENPTLVNNLFTTASQVAKNDPSLGAAAKEHVIKFSETNPTEYKQITEMVLKTALVDPTWASNIFVNILKVDLITCQGAAQGGSATCDCKDGEYPAITDGTPSTTSPTTPEPTPIDEENGVGAEGEGSVDENTSPIPGDYSTPDGGETEGNGEITDETTPVPGDYSSPDAVDTSSPEGEGSVDPEEEVSGEGEGSVETGTEPEVEGGAEEELEYSRPSPPKPASYARPAVAAK